MSFKPKNTNALVIAKLSDNVHSEHGKQGSTDTILSKLFFRMMKDLNIKFPQWNHLMVQYINDPKKCIPANTKDQSSARGNLQKELFKPRMSWKVFCKGIRFINILKFKITITAFHVNGKVTEHGLMVDFGDTPETD